MSLRSSLACWSAPIACGMLVSLAHAAPLTVEEVVRRVRDSGGWDAANPTAALVALAGRGSLIGVPQDQEMLLSPKGTTSAATVANSRSPREWWPAPACPRCGCVTWATRS